MTKKLNFEDMTIVFPTEKDMEEDWRRLQQYMEVYFENRRKNKRIDAYDETIERNLET